MTRCLLGLGSNLGDRQAMLRSATRLVSGIEGCRLLARSSWHETAPIGGPSGQGAFLNGALTLLCSVAPQHLVAELQAIESQLGREREVRWDARAIDIDLLLYGSESIESPTLQVPHPRMSFRRFVLEPAAEIAGSMVDPVSGWTISQLLSHLCHAPRYVAVTSAKSAVATWLAERIWEVLGCYQLQYPVVDRTETGDLHPPTAVELEQHSSAVLSVSHWQKDSELSKRLECGDGKLAYSVTPVVSDFWPGAARWDATKPFSEEVVPMKRGMLRGAAIEGHRSKVRPALVIALEPSSEKKFLEKIEIKKTEKKDRIADPPMSDFRESLRRSSFGPVACIRSDEPDEVLQEAIAAIRSIWPELAEASTLE